MDLSNNDSLEFTLQSEQGLTFDLDRGGVIDLSYNLVTPTVIDAQIYTDGYEVTPKTYSQTLDTANKLLRDDITINEIPYFETSNEEDGITVYIANTIA